MPRPVFERQPEVAARFKAMKGTLPEACSKGHALTEDNTYIRSSGTWDCRTCADEYRTRSREKRKTMTAERRAAKRSKTTTAPTTVRPQRAAPGKLGDVDLSILAALADGRIDEPGGFATRALHERATELGLHMPATLGSLVHALNKLEQLGLIVRKKPTPDSKRTVSIWLTTEGAVTAGMGNVPNTKPTGLDIDVKESFVEDEEYEEFEADEGVDALAFSMLRQAGMAILQAEQAESASSELLDENKDLLRKLDDANALISTLQDQIATLEEKIKASANGVAKPRVSAQQQATIMKAIDAVKARSAAKAGSKK